MDDPFDALAPQPGRGRGGRGGAADRFAAWWDRLRGTGAPGGPTANALAPSPRLTRVLVAVGIVAVLAAGAWWLSQGRAPPVELPRASSPSAAASASAAPTASTAPGASPAPTGSPAPGAAASTVAGSGSTAGSSVPQDVVVHIAGQVNHPGLYTVNAGGRLADAVDAAGGVTAQADLDRINLAEPLIDGARTYIPAVGQLDAPGTIPQGPQPGAQAPSAAPGGPGSPSAGTAKAGASGAAPAGEAVEGALVNINTADEAALDELPGVGPVTAEAIVEYRTQVGSFSQVEDLLEVRGIGDAKLEALLDLVTV